MFVRTKISGNYGTCNHGWLAMLLGKGLFFLVEHRWYFKSFYCTFEL